MGEWNSAQSRRVRSRERKYEDALEFRRYVFCEGVNCENVKAAWLRSPEAKCLFNRGWEYDAVVRIGDDSDRGDFKRTVRVVLNHREIMIAYNDGGDRVRLRRKKVVDRDKWDEWDEWDWSEESE